MRRGLWIWWMGLFLTLAFPYAQGHAEILDRIVAIVNGEIVTMRELNQRVDMIAAASSVSDPIEISNIRKDVLGGMVDQILVLQEGERKGVQVSDEEVKAAIANIKESNNLSEADFEAELKSKGLTLDIFKKEMRADMTRTRLVRNEIQLGIVISEAEIDAYIQEHGAEIDTDFYPSPTEEVVNKEGKIRLRNIFIGLPGGANAQTVESKKDLIKKILLEIKDGLEFSAAASKYSEAPNADTGGDLGWIALEDMDPKIREVVQTLKPGHVSPPMVTPQGIMIFQVAKEEKTAGKPKKTKPKKAEVKSNVSREQRDQIRTMLANRMLERRYEEWIQGLRSNALIKINQ